MSPYSTSDEPTASIDTIPFPLGSVSGVVFYKSPSVLPALDKEYALWDSSVVSDLFIPVRSNFVNMSNVLGFTYPNDSFNRNAVINLITSKTSFIYAIGQIQYTVTNQYYVDNFPDEPYYEPRDDVTNQDCFFKVDTNYGILTYLSGIDSGFSRMALDEQNTVVYLLKKEEQNMIIKKISVNDGTISDVYNHGSSIEPYDMKLGPDGNLYVSLHGMGQILKVTPSGTTSIYAKLEYPSSIYGFNDGTNNNTYKGKIMGIAFDLSGNLYVSDDGTSFNQGTYSSFNGSKKYSSPYIFRIPYNNVDGTVYNPDDAIAKGDEKLSSYQMMFGNFGELYIIPNSEQNLYKTGTDISFNNVFVTGDKIATHYENDMLTKDSWGNLYYVNNTNGIDKISTDYFIFTNVSITDYHSDISLSLVLKDGADIISDKVLVFSSLNTDTSLSVFTINGDTVSDNARYNVTYGTTSVTVVATPSDMYASRTITGDTELSTGNNFVSVLVTAQDGTTYTYNVSVFMSEDNGGSPSSDTSLSVFTINGDNVISGDTVNVSYTTSVTVVATPTNILSSALVTGDTGLGTGTNTVSVVVTAEDLSEQTYTVTVVVAEQVIQNSDTSLSVFTINGTSVTHGSIVNMPYTTSVTVIATPTNNLSSALVTGDTGLGTGTNTVSVVVTAEDLSEQTYTVTVVVEFSVFTINGVNMLSLSTIRFPSNVTSVDVVFTPYDDSSVSISGNTNLKTGNNTITVIATPSSGPPRTYTRNVTISSPCLLKGTLIKTPNGYVPIEKMKIGDEIVSDDEAIVKVTKIGKWECDADNKYDKLDLSKVMYKIPAGEYKCTTPVYISHFHRILAPDKWLRFAKNLGCKVATVSELSESGLYTIYNLAVEQDKHLVVNGGCVVESWTEKR